MASLKEGKITKIVREFVKAGDSYDITGIDLGLAKFFWRQSKELFADLATGDYRIDQSNGKQTLVILNSELLNRVEAFQVGYGLDFTASPYEVEWNVDINTLKEKYNTLVDNMGNLWEYVRKTGMIADDSTVNLILPQLDNDQFWIMQDGQYKAFDISDFRDLGERLLEAYVEYQKSLLELLFRNARENIITTKENSITEIQGLLDALNLNVDNFTGDKKLELQRIIDNFKAELSTIEVGNANALQGYQPMNFERVEPTIADLIASKKYKVGDVVQVLGYYSAGDGGGHPRIKKPIGYNGADAVIGADGSIWGIVHSGEVDIKWFGAKGDGINDDTIAIQKAIDFEHIANGYGRWYRTTSPLNLSHSSCLKKINILLNHSGVGINLNQRVILEDVTTKRMGYYKEKGYSWEVEDVFYNCEAEIKAPFNCSYCTLENINTNINTKAIDCENGLGASCLTNITGVSTDTFIRISNSYDINHLYSIHSNYNLAGFTLDKTPNLINIIGSQSKFLSLGKVDWLDVVGGSSYGYNKHLDLVSSVGVGGSADKIMLTNFNADYCTLYVNGLNNQGFSITNSYFTQSKPLGSGKVDSSQPAIYLTGEEVCLFTNVGSTLIDGKVLETSQKVLFANCNFSSGLSSVNKGILCNSYQGQAIGGFVFKNEKSTHSSFTNCILEINKDTLQGKRYFDVENENIVLNFNNISLVSDAPLYQPVGIQSYIYSVDGISVASDVNKYENTEIRKYFLKVGGRFYANTGVVKEISLIDSPLLTLDTPYHATNMQKLGILDDYHNYLTELHEYEKSQNVQSDSEIMALNVLQPPVIPTEVEAYAKEYNLI